MKPDGIFIFRFHTILEQDELLKHNFWYFDKKPLVLKPWSVVQTVNKEDIACFVILAICLLGHSLAIDKST